MSVPVLQAVDLSVELGGLPVLRGINLSVSAGEAMALMGGNGSGKSTLVRSLLGLIPARRGTVTLFDTSLSDFREWSRIGYVPQRSPAPLAGAKVREVVAAGRLSRRRPFVPMTRTDRAAIARALELVGMGDRAGSDIAQLSGGQHQRVLIARALAGDAELILLDEPNAGVDLEHQQILASILATLIASGTAVLVILHEVGPLAKMIDRAVVLREGRIAYDGSLNELWQLRPGGHSHHEDDRHDNDHDLAIEYAAPWLDGAIDR